MNLNYVLSVSLLYADVVFLIDKKKKARKSYRRTLISKRDYNLKHNGLVWSHAGGVLLVI